MEATILEIRTKKFAKEENLGRLVLDNNQIVLDDWVIQRFVKNEETGEVTVAREGCMIKDHKFKKGKLKGSDPLKNRRMEALISEFREDIKAYGAGDQLRSSGGGGEADTESDDEESSSDTDTEQQSKTTTKGKAKGSAAKKIQGGGKGRGGGGSGSSSVGGGTASGGGGGSASSGRKTAPSPEDEEEAIAMAIARLKNKTKKQPRGNKPKGKLPGVKSPGGGSSGPTKNAKILDTNVKEKGAKNHEASVGKGGKSKMKKKGQEVAPRKSKDKERKNEAVAQKGAAGASKKRSDGGRRGGEIAPDPKRPLVDLTGTGGRGAGAGAGATGKPKAAKKHRTFFSSLVTPPSGVGDQQRPNKKQKKERQSKPGATRAPQGPPKKKQRMEEGQQRKPEATGPPQGPPKKKLTKDEQQSNSDAKGAPPKSPKKKPEKEQQQSKRPVLPAGGGAGSAGGRVDRGNDDSERKFAKMATAPMASKGHTTSGWQGSRAPKPAATAGAGDEAETDWRVTPHDGKTPKPSGGAP